MSTTAGPHDDIERGGTAMRRRLLRAIERHRGGDAAGASAEYLAIVEADPRQFDAWRLLGAALIDAGQYRMAVESLDHALALSPGSAEVWVLRGNALAHLRAHEHAAESYRRGLTLGPGTAHIWNQLGMQWHALRRADHAVDAFLHATALAPQAADIHCNLGKALMDAGALDKALASYRCAAQLDPDLIEAHRGQAACLTALRRLPEALASCDRALAILSNAANSHETAELLRFNRALLQLTLGDFTQGWEGYELRPSNTGRSGRRTNSLWRQGDIVTGRRVLLAHEQGLGDSIQFCRFARCLARDGAQVTIEVPPTLVDLIASLDPAIRVTPPGQDHGQVDLFCPLPSLGHRLSVDPGTLPSEEAYLSAPAELVASWAARLGSRRRPRVGIAFAGNADHLDDRNRSIALGTLRRLLTPDVEWHLLQTDLRADDAAVLAQVPLIDHRQDLADFAHTGALATQMDMVISVDTSVAHLAGALGVPVIVMLPFVPDWRWGLNGSRSWWYRSAQLVRQEIRGDWSLPLAQVADRVAALVAPPKQR